MLVEIVFFDAGGGHRSAMNALQEYLTGQHPEWIVKAVDLQKLLEPIDPVYKFTKKFIIPFKKVSPRLDIQPVQSQTLYNIALKKGMTHGAKYALPVLQEFIQRNAPQIENLLKQSWLDEAPEKPKLVISVIPNFNRVLFRALRAVHKDVPYLTIMTDMMDCPPSFWMEKQDQHLICGTKDAYRQANKTHFYKPEKVHRVSGMILRKSFYAPPQENGLTREKLGLSPNALTAIIMFGGNGSRVSEKIVKKLEAARTPLQTIVMCGKNKKLYAALKDKANCVPIGFVSNVADYMRLADFFIGKPGPGSLSEALHLGCPVIVENNRSTMPQERPNVGWILENDVGISVKSLSRDSVKAVQNMEKNLKRYKQNIETNLPKNKALFEIAVLIEDLMKANKGKHSPMKHVDCF